MRHPLELRIKSHLLYGTRSSQEEVDHPAGQKTLWVTRNELKVIVHPQEVLGGYLGDRQVPASKPALNSPGELPSHPNQPPKDAIMDPTPLAL
ncbi:hypothetical protein EYF80_047764 [Liparis tanakae]|uniref:Uncharacterized protein n=1 Tax=Liparis tanakae TaxID=230148 RepID=A0A4Z2FMR1_9TELE|nr:hypothetical protein EYF80_047764 [Liparis tanakae]